MEVSELIQAISTVGFPIVMCLLFMYYIKYINDQHKDEIDKLKQQISGFYRNIKYGTVLKCTGNVNSNGSYSINAMNQSEHVIFDFFLNSLNLLFINFSC